MANKKIRQIVMDQNVETMKEIYRIVEEKSEAKHKEQIERLNEQIKETALTVEFATKIKIKDSDEAQARFLRVLFLRQIKERLKQEGKWTDFCNSNGINIQNADREIKKLGEFRDELLIKFGSAVGYDINKIKYIGNDDLSNVKVTVDLEGQFITYGDERIPLTAEDVQEILELQEEAHKKQTEDKDTEIRTKERILQAKEDVIKRQEKDIARFELTAERRGLTLEEDAFLKRIEVIKIGWDGYMMEADPERVDRLKEEAATPRMKAALIALIEYMYRNVMAARDQVIAMYGDYRDDDFKWRSIEEMQAEVKAKKERG